MGDQMPESVLVEKSPPTGGERFEAKGNAYQEGTTPTDTAAATG